MKIPLNGECSVSLGKEKFVDTVVYAAKRELFDELITEENFYFRGCRIKLEDRKLFVNFFSNIKSYYHHEEQLQNLLADVQVWNIRVHMFKNINQQ
jgi:hypothetical protein